VNDFAGLVPELRPYADELCRQLRKAGYSVVITSVRRTRSQQAALYSRWLRGQNPYPVAPPGSSQHELGLAFDMDVRYAGQDAAAEAGQVWRSWGGQWSPSDRVHFGLP
jgi:LAS superfamily LD-carboxypeptidase LdcB